MTGRRLVAVESVIKHEGPDAVLVYGDTNSTLAGALASAKLGVPVFHVEAGLRSFNRSMPEEINRVLVDHVSALLFCPTRVAVENLSREGITSGVHAVGDVMFDATFHARERASRASDVLERIGVRAREYSVATIHRQENTDDAGQLRKVVEYLQDVARSLPVVFPLHPRTRLAAKRHGLSLEGLHCCEPVGYLDMTRLLATSACVFTDSGGLQKEAYFHGVPCVTLRAETEWVETVEHGWNRLWSSSHYLPRRPIDDYGCGDASERIVERMLVFLCSS
jgi:UDP-GlcNAc3NAcA epimerase